MPHKVVAINHQTFISGNEAQAQYFRFSKVYKTKPSQKFLVKPISLMFYVADKADPEPHIMVLKGLNAFNGELNVQPSDSTSSQTQTLTNKVCLGVVGGGLAKTGNKQGASIQIESPTFLVNEIPLNDFIIETLHPDATVAEDANYLVQFQIETIEEY